MTRSEACAIAAPLIIIEREPPVPAPNTSWSESPCTRRMRSNGTPRREASTCANGAACPWP